MWERWAVRVSDSVREAFRVNLGVGVLLSEIATVAERVRSWDLVIVLDPLWLSVHVKVSAGGRLLVSVRSGLPDRVLDEVPGNRWLEVILGLPL